MVHNTAAAAVLSSEIDFVALAEPVARRLLGNPNKNLSKPGKIRWGSHGSFLLNTETGVWWDFEREEGGGVLDLVARECGGTRSGAVEWLRREGFATEDRPRANGHAATNGHHRAKGVASMPRKLAETYDYTDEHGDLRFQVCRFEPKDFLQRRPDGKGGWIWDLKGVHRVLYRLPEVIEEVAQGRPIFICEGEKDCDNLANIGVPATTNPGGANKWSSEFNEFLRGADVILLPDNDDDPGREHMHAVAASLTGTAKRVRLLDLAKHWAECPAKGDISDWLAGGGTVEKLRDLVEATPDWAPPAGADASLDDDVDYDVESYQMVRTGDNAGLYHLVERKEGRDRVWVSAPFTLLGRARDPHGGSWARWLSWNDGDGRAHTHAIADTKLHGDPGALCAELAAGGLKIATKRHRDFVAYVNLIESKVRLTAVERTGWHEVENRKVFVMPTRAFGNVEGERVVFLGSQHSPYQERGTLADWQANVAAPITGHDLPVFAVSASFAAPLAGLVGIEGGGFNFFGLSSTGKTTIIQAAASVYGRGDEHGFVATWRNTANAMEGTAVLHTDVPMVLDELGIAEPREVGAVIYQLATGIGKGRADKTGAARERKSWRTLIISTGELRITDKIVEGGCRAKAGQEVRVVDISADAGAGCGVFNDLGDGDARALADSIKAAAVTNYGTAGPAFIGAVIGEGTEKVVPIVKDAIASFAAEISPPGAGGQIERAARRFSLVATAGELAIQLGIVLWPAGSAKTAAKALFESWVSARGGTGPAEVRNAIRRVKALLGRYGDSRFDLAAGGERPVQERWGWRWGDGENREWGILPGVWRETFCSGFDANMVAKVLDGRGVLRHPTGRLQGQMKINGVPHWLYLLSAQKLEALDDE